MITYILLYSIDYDEGVLAEMPYAASFGERSLARLGLLRSPDVRVVLVLPRPVGDDIIDYHLRDVVGLDEGEAGRARARLRVVSPRGFSPVPLVHLVLDDPDLIEQLRTEAAAADAAVLVNFTPSAEMEDLATRLGAVVEEGPWRPAEQWGSKSGSKTAFRLSGIAACRGSSTPWFSVASVRDAALRLATTAPRPAQVVVKLDHASWSGGVGNAVIDCRLLLEGGDLAGAVHKVLQPWDAFVRRIPTDGAIVEEYVPSSSSPSGQGTIDAAGVVTVRGSHQQILRHGEYVGCIFPAPENLRDRIGDAVFQVGKTLAQSGVRGTFGVDFLALETGELFAAEINVRKLGPTHVSSYVETVVGDRLRLDGTLERSGTPIAYVNRRRPGHPEWLGVSPATARAALKAQGLLFDRATRSGAILHILGALPTCGFVETTCVAPSVDEARAVDAQVTAVLATMGT
jgi:L-propargylglycine--L-glutamate ligase